MNPPPPISVVGFQEDEDLLFIFFLVEILLEEYFEEWIN
jgi:hypothetical protein